MKIFIGCAAYREMKPATAMSMVEVAFNHRAGKDESAATPPCDVVGGAIVHGYGACRNVEALAHMALDALGPQGFLLYHDADIVYDCGSVDSIAVFARGVAHSDFERRHVVAAIYPSAWAERTIVGSAGGDPVSYYGVRGAPAQRIGFGFVLIPLSIFDETWGKPWFRESWNGEQLLTPDTIFCARAVAAGHRVWVAEIPGVKHHVTTLEAVHG